MTKLIGQITYPKQEGLAVEYAKLFSEENSTVLLFRLINHGKKTVNAYRVELTYTAGGAEKKEVIQGRNLELISGSATDEITCALSGAVEEGSITLSAVIYDDLSHNQTAPTFPFASFDIISRKAESLLSGTAPITCAKAPSEPAKESLTAIAKGQSTAPASPAVEKAKNEIPVKKSSAPLVLALCALGGIILSFFLRAVFAYYIADTWGPSGGMRGGTTLGEAFTILWLVFLAIYTACAALALTAILIYKKNPGQSVAVIVVSVLALLIYLYVSLIYSLMLSVIAVLLLAIVFLILALVKKNTALLVTALSMALIVFVIIGLASGCVSSPKAPEDTPSQTGIGTVGTPDTTATPTPNTPVVYASEYIELTFSSYDPGERLVSGCSYTICSSPVALNAWQMPVENGRFDLVIPEYDPDGNRVMGVAENAFSGNMEIQSLTLPASATVICGNAFSNCQNLKTVDLSPVEYLYEEAFRNCYNLESVTGTANLKEIGNSAFDSCMRLQSFSFGSNLFSIGNNAFTRCALTYVEIPESVTHLGYGIFFECADLREAIIFADFYQIPAETFAYCGALERVYIPSSVVEIRDDAFRVCHSLYQIEYGAGEDEWNAIAIGTNNNPIYNASVYYYVAVERGEPAA